MVRTVFNRIENSSENIEFTVKVSMVEIYMEKIKDLLDPTKTNMMIKQDKQKGIFIHDLTERYIGSDEEVYDIMAIGNENRATACTKMNDSSSRSHSMFLMTVTQTNLEDNSCKSGKLYLIDLAGSEKVGKTGASGQTLKEAQGINKSLSCLGKVIKALTDGKSKHIPYRESKLTRLLSESLGGNAKTSLIITCSPSPYNVTETISTLRFGTAARNIKNTPKINKEMTVGELKRLLNKSERIIAIKSFRVEILEKHITENQLEIPEDEYEEEIKGMVVVNTHPSPHKRTSALSDHPKEGENKEENKSDPDSSSESSQDEFEVIFEEEKKEEIHKLKSELEDQIEREKEKFKIQSKALEEQIEMNQEL